MSLSLHVLPADESPDPSEEFVSLLTQHQRVLLAFILGLVPARNDAEEIRQRTNIVLWRKRDDFQSGTSFRSWAFTVARWEARGFLREQGRKSWLVYDDEVASLLADRLASIPNPTLGKRGDALRKCLGELGDEHRQLINVLENAYNLYGRPVWLTEFSVVRWSGTATWTYGDNYNFLAEFMWRAESLPWLRRYSLFNFREGASGPNQDANDPPEAPRSNSIRADGTLTPFGELYATWDGVTQILEHKAYHLHNHSRYRRARNPSDADTIASIAPDNGTDADQWFLIPGTTANTVRICSTADGRRLRYFNGTHVGLAASTNVQPQTEWRLVPVTSGANHDGLLIGWRTGTSALRETS